MKLFLFSFLVFLGIFFVFNNFSGTAKNNSYDTRYGDEEYFSTQNTDFPNTIDSLLSESQTSLETAPEDEEKIKEIQNNNIISFRYSPESFKEEAEEKYAKAISETLDSDIFLSKVEDLLVIFYEEEYQIRGNMKNRIIRLHDSDRIGANETLAVFLHELAHYIDLYYLKKEDNFDFSYEFYSISWLSTTIALPGQDEADFVSGYAATNAYEDFSESFLYYILHNREFIKKAESSPKLQEKYNFFKTRVFSEGSFEKSNFSTSKHALYNWDVTKLEFSLENFLDYLKKSI